VAALKGLADPEKPIEIQAKGGTLYIEVELDSGTVRRAFMNGPAEFVFWGEIQA